jgi:non-ribosomal peptide synthetase component F
MEDALYSVFRHQKYNYGDLLLAIREEYGCKHKLYDVIVSYQNATVMGQDIETTWYHSGMQIESLQIHIDDRDNQGIYRIHYDYQTDKFTEEEISRMHQQIKKLLFDAIENNTKMIYELSLLTQNEEQKLIYDFNNTEVNCSMNKCIHQLFEEQVVRIPNKTAVIACDKILTYAELNEEANKIANSLVKIGIGVGDIVAFGLMRKINPDVIDIDFVICTTY